MARLSKNLGLESDTHKTADTTELFWILAMSHELSFQYDGRRTTALRHTVAAYIVGTIPKMAEGYQYLLLMTDLDARFRQAYLLQRTRKTEFHLLESITAITCHLQQPLTCLRFENTN